MELNQIPEEYLPKPFTNKVEFKDGSSIKASGGLNDTDDHLWIWTEVPMSFIEAVEIFSNPEKTDKIILHHSAIETQTLEHYTRLSDIKEGANGTKSIQLKR